MRKPLSLFAIIIFAIAVPTVGAQDVPGDASKEKAAQEAASGDLTPVEQPRLPELNLSRPVGGKLTVRVSIDELGNVTKVEDIIGPGSYCSNSSDPDIRAIRQAAHDAALTAKFRPRLRSYDVRQESILFELPIEPTTQKMISGGILNEKAVNLPPPSYPAAALAVGATGIVGVQVIVDTDGSVEKAKAVSGHPLLRRSAENAACEAKFAPVLLNGSPVKFGGILNYKFEAPE